MARLLQHKACIQRYFHTSKNTCEAAKEDPGCGNSRPPLRPVPLRARSLQTNTPRFGSRRSQPKSLKLAENHHKLTTRNAHTHTPRTMRIQPLQRRQHDFVSRGFRPPPTPTCVSPDHGRSCAEIAAHSSNKAIRKPRIPLPPPHPPTAHTKLTRSPHAHRGIGAAPSPLPTLPRAARIPRAGRPPPQGRCRPRPH